MVYGQHQNTSDDKKIQSRQKSSMVRTAIAVWRGYTYFYYRIYTCIRIRGQVLCFAFDG